MDGHARLHWQTFVVRLHREPGSAEWRGEIVHLPDQQALRFATLAEAVAFIAAFAPGIEEQKRNRDAPP